MSNNRNRKHKKPIIGAGYRPPFAETILAAPTSDLDVREETQTLLAGAKILTLCDVLIREEKDFYRIPTFNKKNLLDLKAALKKKNLFLRPTPEVKENAGAEKTEIKGDNPPARPPKNGEKKQDRSRQAQHGEKKSEHGTQSQKPEKPKTERIKEEPDIYVKINKGGKWGFKDRDGNQKVNPIYDEVFSYKEDLCCVEKDEKFGFINRDGEEVIPIVYDCAVSFSEGYACVFKGEKCGYINTKNEVAIDFRFDAGTPVIGGECRVKRDGKWGELHLDNPSEIRWIN